MDTKGLLKSTTFYGSLLTALPTIVGILASGLPQAVQAGTALVGVLVTIYGRIKASTQISGLL